MTDTASSTESPVFAPPESDRVDLLGGIIFDGTPIKVAQVREMNGEDEEFFSRKINAKMTGAEWMDLLLTRCVVRFGDLVPPGEMARRLCIGDRQLLALRILYLSYGGDIEVEKFMCSKCGQVFSCVIEIMEDIKTKELPDFIRPDLTFDLDLGGGRLAKLRLPTGFDELAAVGVDKTEPEVVTKYIDSCCLEIDGSPSLNLGKKLKAGDRNKIHKALLQNQPGPMLGEVNIQCMAPSGCHEEVGYPFRIDALFRSQNPTS